MTEHKDSPSPSPGELEILRALWQLGPSTVREVHERLSRGRDVGYTTVLKLLQIMNSKGLVRRDPSKRAHVYMAVATEEKTQKRLVGELLERAFGGSAQKMVLRALEARPVSRDELVEIRALLDSLEEKKP